MDFRVPGCATSWTCLLIASLFGAGCDSEVEGPDLQEPPARDGGHDEPQECLAFGASPARTCEPPDQGPIGCTESCPEDELYGDEPSSNRRTVPSLSPAGDRRLIALDGGDLIDLTDPHAPKHIGWPLDISERIVSSAIEGDLGAVLVRRPLQLIAAKIEDGRSRAIGSSDIAGQSARMTRRGELALVFSIDDAQRTAWLTTFRLSRSAAPERIAQLEWPYASEPESMQHGRVMASFADGRVYIVRPSRAGARSSTELLAIDVAADGALEATLPPLVIDGLVLDNERVEESGGIVRVLATGIEGGPPLGRLSMFARDDLALRGELAIQGDVLGGSIEGGVALIKAAHDEGVRVLVAKLGEPPGELYALNGVEPSAAVVIADGQRLLVQRSPSDGDGSYELALYDLTGEAIAELDTLALEGATEPDLRYSDELGVALYARPAEELDDCIGSTDVELVRVSSDGFETLGAVQVSEVPNVASAGERLLLEAGGRFATVDPSALEAPRWINARFEAERLAVAGEQVARVGLVAWSDDPWLDVVAPQDAAGPPRGGRALLPASGSGCARQVDHLHRSDEHAFAMFTHERIGREEGERSYSVAAINLEDPAKPRIVSKTLIPNLPMGASLDGGVSASPEFLGATPAALIFQSWADEDLSTPVLQWLDVSDPKEPELHAIALHEGLASTFFAAGVVAATHVDGDGTRWLQRTALTDPADVRVRQTVELPSELLAYDPASDRALLYREPDESCSHEGWDLAIAELGRGASCVIAVASKQGRPTANARAFAELSAQDNRLRLGTWDRGAIASTVIELPDGGDYSGLALTGTRVIVHGTPTLIYDARCPDVEPAQLVRALLADVAESDEPGIFVRDGDALAPAPLPDCKR